MISKRKDSKQKFQSISKDVLKRSILALVITVTLTSLFAFIYFNNIIVNISNDKASASLHVVENEIASIKKTFEEHTKEISQEEVVINSAKTKTSNNVQVYFEKLKDSNNIAIVDESGIIITSNENKLQTGDDISNNQIVISALSGKVYTEIGRGPSGEFGLYTASPIYDGDKIVGAIFADYNLEDADFSDKIKAIVNTEVSIFENDIRINTTIIQDGKRMLGTKLDPKVTNTVIIDKKEYLGKADVLGKTFTTAYKPIIDVNGEVKGVLSIGSDYSAIESKIFQVILIICLISLMSMLISIYILNMYFRKKLKNPLEKLVNAAKAIEIGEINEEVSNQLILIDTNDEMGLLARSMEGAVESVKSLAKNINGYKEAIENYDLTYSSDSSNHKGIYLIIVHIVGNLFTELRDILNEIKIAADGIDAGAEHVSSAAQVLAQGATEQASSTEELAATISDIAEVVQHDANNAINVSKLAKETSEVGTQSSQYMKELMNAMEEINQSSKNIEKIIKTIDDIAFQTNILALNAAVEAARAGTAGKGFSVVADEVRNLASKCQEAVKNTSQMIENSAAAVNKGTILAKETEAALISVVEKTVNANALLDEIAEASQKQSDSIYQINIGVDQISSVVQENSATAEQIAASSEELSGQANSLKAMVSKYRLSAIEHSHFEVLPQS